MSHDGAAIDPDNSHQAVFHDFAGRLRAGEDDAARELLARYSSRLVAQARRRLGPRLVLKVDPDDVLQSVFRTFFRRLDCGRIELRDWSSLTGLLSLLTLRKCQREARRFATAGRNVGIEVSLDGPGVSDVAAPDREPTPEEVAAFGEIVERLFENLDERDRQVVSLLFSGENIDGAASRLRRSRPIRVLSSETIPNPYLTWLIPILVDCPVARRRRLEGRHLRGQLIRRGRLFRRDAECRQERAGADTH